MLEEQGLYHLYVRTHHAAQVCKPCWTSGQRKSCHTKELKFNDASSNSPSPSHPHVFLEGKVTPFCGISF